MFNLFGKNKIIKDLQEENKILLAQIKELKKVIESYDRINNDMAEEAEELVEKFEDLEKDNVTLKLKNGSLYETIRINNKKNGSLYGTIGIKNKKIERLEEKLAETNKQLEKYKGCYKCNFDQQFKTTDYSKK